MTNLVVNLQPQLDAAMVGAKAANLGKAMAHGINVPPGFVVTRNALNLFLQQTGLMPQVEAFVSQCMLAENIGHAAEFDEVCRQVLAAPIPDSLSVAVAEMAALLLAQAPAGVAVRSSGVHEDSATASFAGIYESYLGIRSSEALWVAIKHCWCSAWTPQAIAYAKRMGITPAYDAMAVLIQQLVVADSAGVLFTANPRTGNPWQFILESTLGLAQELVGSVGDVPADQFVLAWDTGQIIEKQIAEKPATCVPSESGVHAVAVSRERSTEPSLSDALAIALAQVALALDRSFGCRVDIEWAVADGEIHIVQVRPITALPAFFPHHLPPHLADETWKPLWPYWYFPHNQMVGKVVPPLYQEFSYAEMFVRYQVGPIDLHNGRFSGLELDFHGHRYHIAEPRASQVKPSLAELEAYLQEYEPALRQQWLDTKHHKIPAVTAKAVELQQGANSLQELIDALLWAIDAGFDLGCRTIGPPQCLFGVCITLFDAFLAHHLPDLTADALKQGHHPDLEPYYPHVQIQEAEALAAAFAQDPIQQLFATMEVQSLFEYLVEHHDSSPFAHAYNAYCERLGLVPLRWHEEIQPDEKAVHYAAIQIMRDAFLGKGGGLVANNEQVRQRRQECEAQFRQALTKNEPALLPRFDRLLDWLYFWGPALNDRGWEIVPYYELKRLWMTLCRKLQAIGLIDTPTDIGYFKTEELAYIASTGDLATGRQLWQHRRLAYEWHDRLQPPSSLGKALDKSAEVKHDGTTKESVSPPLKQAKTVIHGRGHSPGQASGVAYKIATLDESTTVTDQHILILTQTITPTSQYSALLLTLILRVRGIIIVQAGGTYTHHIAQIARECGVPVLEIAPSDLDHIPDHAELLVDGSAGTVTLVT